MKSAMTLLLFLLFFSVEAQVTFRSDIVMGKHVGSKSRGLSFITLGLGARRGFPGLNDRQVLIIDIAALRNPNRSYNYRQLAERVYGLMPGVPATHPSQPFVPAFLLNGPPKVEATVPVVRVRR